MWIVGMGFTVGDVETGKARRGLCCETLIWKVKVLVTQSCPPLWDPVDCSPPGSSVHGILQARILEWVAIPFSRGSSLTPKIKARSPASGNSHLCVKKSYTCLWHRRLASVFIFFECSVASSFHWPKTPLGYVQCSDDLGAPGDILPRCFTRVWLKIKICWGFPLWENSRSLNCEEELCSEFQAFDKHWINKGNSNF